ncbi:hypothetical protein PsorP6_007347 [Peronosclerospora sorghi]|uniref:Uncharacterized protein n=1 Tax=Peronosclerospora sorghi TaxID=230839 RepID=A0ACC0WB90_9STRA|nr:hypothetical protein PsorP6_007347 [Peronosclerospora sorghi]
MSSAVEIDGSVDVDEDDDDEQDEDASMNHGVYLNYLTVDNDDRAVGAGAQDTGTGVDTNTDDGANNDSASAVSGSVDRDSHASEPSHDSPTTAEEGDQVSTEEGNNMPAVDSESGRDEEPQLHDGESAGEDQQSDGTESTTGVCGSVCGSMDMNNLGENQRGVSVEIDGPVATLEPDIDQFMEQARVLKRDGRKYFSQLQDESADGDRMEGTSDVRNVLEEVQMETIKNSMLKRWKFAAKHRSSSFPVYRKIWKVHHSEDVDSKSIDDAIYERDVQMAELVFQAKFTSVMRAGNICSIVCLYVDNPIFLSPCSLLLRVHKLKEQELRNLVSICECIVQNQRDAITNFIPIFSESATCRGKGSSKH